jgi:hypothetical protein
MKDTTLLDMNTEDFNAMRSMLSDIELKIMQLDPMKQRQFYLPIRDLIIEAHRDVNNPDDTFLFPK